MKLPRNWCHVCHQDHSAAFSAAAEPGPAPQHHHRLRGAGPTPTEKEQLIGEVVDHIDYLRRENQRLNAQLTDAVTQRDVARRQRDKALTHIADHNL